MHAIKPLSIDELQALSQALPLWHIEPSGAWMQRDFVFNDFIQAFGFMTQVAMLAQVQDHHPNWSNVYSTVSIKLFTHDCQRLTLRDRQLALAIEQLR
jgi:4a-hydroxytetrahydrobiopterin dehydratase